MNKRQIHILWWGRFGNYGPDYPRNRTLIQCMKTLGWYVTEFQPRISALGHWEATLLKRFADVTAVWVPCFRQRDVIAASKWAKRYQLPLIFDPLISAYDKRVNERKKFGPDSRAAQHVLRWERGVFANADHLIADTNSHKDYYANMLDYNPKCITVLPVSAEEAVFYPDTSLSKNPPLEKVPELLFFGTFINLQGAEYITQAMKYYRGPEIRLSFLGDGPERQKVESLAMQNSNSNIAVSFESWIPFEKLGDRIRQAQICMGIFGTGEKSFRVIPNKVYQALACDKAVITMEGEAYPAIPENTSGGIYWCHAGDPPGIAKQMGLAAEDYLNGLTKRQVARQIYENYFSNHELRARLTNMIERV